MRPEALGQGEHGNSIADMYTEEIGCISAPFESLDKVSILNPYLLDRCTEHNSCSYRSLLIYATLPSLSSWVKLPSCLMWEVEGK
ncbi:hypothetical protein PIB30_052531 [Stylosanthes scabra]|nr:hypothetical protein [Stylosanthes scabra]